MEASTKPTRKRRYERQQSSDSISLTPVKQRLLRYIARFGIVSLPQLALLTELSQKRARHHLRELFDANLVDIIAVSRAALADAQAKNDTHLLFGSAPNIYRLTKQGVKALIAEGWEVAQSSRRAYGPKNSLFIAHELEVRDARVWLELATRKTGKCELSIWKDGAEAEIDLNRATKPQLARPDAWFVVSIGEKALVGLVEVDRGTERGEARWKEKAKIYEVLFQGDILKQATGYKNARVLIVTPNQKRCDQIAEILREYAPRSLHGRFWLTTRNTLQQFSITEELWHILESDEMRPLLRDDI